MSCAIVGLRGREREDHFGAWLLGGFANGFWNLFGLPCESLHGPFGHQQRQVQRSPKALTPPSTVLKRGDRH